VLQSVSPPALKTMLSDGEELALIDVREELIFSEGHLFFARCVPLSRLELRFPALVPRRSTRIVLCDDGDGLGKRAGEVLARSGYNNLFALAGGLPAWSKHGYELFSGVNVPSKAFGEFVEHACATPSIAAEELHRLIVNGDDVVVVDSRPFDEYQRVSIPTATNVPGAELVLRIRDIAPSARTTVVVNCAGRTRSIIGAQSLINAGVPNKVLALRNGTMGWSLAGLTCESGDTRRFPALSPGSVAFARSAADRVARRFGIARIDRKTLDAFRNDGQRTLYVFDVRDPTEYAPGHFPGARSAPGGQLVQATDQYVGTLGARIVLVDEAEVRAVMTASWLRQMGWQDVFVLAESGNETIAIEPEPLGSLDVGRRMSCAELSALMAKDAATVIDLSLSRAYRKAHIPGAWFAIRSQLEQALRKIAIRGSLVLTSEDGMLGGLAAPETSALTDAPVRYLMGGNEAWQKAGYPLAAEPLRMADQPVDMWLKPYERSSDTTKAMRDYLEWEIDLLARVERDGSANFTAAASVSD
jgi:rhodanese-related sulfurtransferase